MITNCVALFLTHSIREQVTNIYYHQPFRHMVTMEVVSELLPGDGFRVGMGDEVRLPP
jgi:hypothetical protein